MLRHIPPPTEPMTSRHAAQQMTDMSGRQEDTHPYQDDTYPSDEGTYPSVVYQDDPQYPNERYADERAVEKPPKEYSSERYDGYPEDYDGDYNGQPDYNISGTHPVNLGDNRAYSNA